MPLWLPASLLPLGLVITALLAASPQGRAIPTACVIPPRACAARCDELVWTAPVRGWGYVIEPVRGERHAARSGRWLRRDVFMAIRHAAARVQCETGGKPIALGDMSEVGGTIPGSHAGEPRHPPVTHTRGLDLDVAYYQLERARNAMNPICAHILGGVDHWHCVGPPRWLDARRTALFIGTLFEAPGVRVVGVDGRAGPLLDAAIATLCEAGTLSREACQRVRLAYEPIELGRGWFLFHHAHLHVSWQGAR